MGGLPKLAEDQHQALDLLESLEDTAAAYLECGGLGPDRDGLGETDAGRAIMAAADEQGLMADELFDSHATVVAALHRYVPAVARQLLSASKEVFVAQAQRLEFDRRILAAIAEISATDSEDGEIAWAKSIRQLPALAVMVDDARANELDGPALAERVRERLGRAEAVLDRVSQDSEDDWAWSLLPALSVTRQTLGIVRGSLVDGMLSHLASTAAPEPGVEQLGNTLSRWIRAAYLETVTNEDTQATAGPANSPGPTPPSKIAAELAAFRLATVRGAGNEIRARALAADEPARIDLAREVARELPDDLNAMSAFAKLVADTRAGETIDTSPRTRFTWMHVALVLALLGLTAWHYWLR